MVRWTAVAALVLGGMLGARGANAGDAPPALTPLRVRVVARDGSPVAGALVEAFARFAAPVRVAGPWEREGRSEIAAAPRGPDPAAAATSGGDGTASLDGLRAAGWLVVVSKPGFARTWSVLSIGDDATTRIASVGIGRGRTLAGRVREPGGAPVAGATVFASPDSRPIWPGDPLLMSTKTAEDGAYAFDGLPDHATEPRVAPPGAIAATHETIDVARVSVFDVTLPPRAAPVKGSILDFESRTPIVGATVRVADAGRESAPRVAAAAAATTDA